MTEIIRETHRRLIEAAGYKGTCLNCGEAIESSEPFFAIEVEDTEFYRVVVPIDIMACPHCLWNVEGMQVWKSVNVTEELKNMEKK